MQENIPEFDNIPRPPKSEQGEVKPADPEFYQQKEAKDMGVRRDWSTAQEANAGADAVAELTRIGQKETPIPEFHDEIPNVRLKVEYNNEKEKQEVISSLISTPPDATKPGVANDLQEKMASMLDQAA